MADRRLTHIHGVREHLGDSLSAHTNELVTIFSRLVNQGKEMLQPHQIIAEFEAVIPEGERKSWREAIVIPPWVALVIHPRSGVWEYERVNVNELDVEELNVPGY